VVTNQSAVARGRLTEVELRRIHDRLVDGLADCGAYLDGIYYCPHHATEGIGLYKVACDCRKPNPGMIRRACAELEIDPTLSYLVGDQATDMELAGRVGACGIWIGDCTSPQYEALASKAPVVLDLWQAAQWIVNRLNHKAREEEKS
jgi:D-glycero-D-manno-heptose 1,7-bisphosphate phosphatase